MMLLMSAFISDVLLVDLNMTFLVFFRYTTIACVNITACVDVSNISGCVDVISISD